MSQDENLPIPTVEQPAGAPAASESAVVATEKKLPKDEYEREVDRLERKQRHWIVRVFVLCIAFICVVIVSSIAYVYVVKGGNFEGSAIQGLMNNLTELLKLFGTPSETP